MVVTIMALTSTPSTLKESVCVFPYPFGQFAAITRSKQSLQLRGKKRLAGINVKYKLIRLVDDFGPS